MDNNGRDVTLGAQWPCGETEQTRASIGPEYLDWEEHTPCPPDARQLNTVRVLTSSPLHQQALSGLPGTY